MIRIDSSQILEGMILAEPIFCGPTNNLLMSAGTIITKSHIHSIKRYNIETIAITERYTILIEPKSAIQKEVKEKLTSEILRLSPDRVEASKSDFMLSVSKIARITAHKVLENPIVIDFLVLINLLDDDYLLRHSIETCAMSLLVAGALGLDKTELYNVGVASILHDVGLCEMPHLIHKPHLLPHEKKLLKEHSVYGHYLTKESGLSRDISRLILYHHKDWNGEGDSDQISEEKIPLGSRIIRVCDHYNRLLRQDKLPEYQAIEYLYGAGGLYFDTKIVQIFFNSLAVYPLGSLVRLTTGEVAVVINVRKNLGPRPIVRVYYNRVNRPLTVPRDVDLGKELTVFIKQVF